MWSLPPSIAPRSVPLTLMPPPRRAGRTALVLAGAAWALVVLVLLFRNELGDEFARPEAWRSSLRRVLLGASGILALASSVPALTGFRRAPLLASLSIALALGWLAFMVWRWRS
ncbi:MAG: hypothetical protein U0263_16910 [Polyangiaceae bacterium]